MSQIQVRPASTADVREIRRLVDAYAGDGPRLLRKNMVTLYEDVQEFLVAVDPALTRSGVGSVILTALLDRARALGVRRVFCLTFATAFFGRHGFVEIDGTPVEPSVFEELLESYDEGVAEFLDLEWVKPNTLGNHRMLLVL